MQHLVAQCILLINMHGMLEETEVLHTLVHGSRREVA